MSWINKIREYFERERLLKKIQYQQHLGLSTHEVIDFIERVLQ